MDVVYIIRDLLTTKNIQKWINNRFSDPDMVIVDSRLFTDVRMTNGLVFKATPSLAFISQVLTDYRFEDIKKDDIVIDIGANVGGFAISASLFSNHVNAVEPIMTEELRYNIAINSKNIPVIEGGLGDGKIKTLIWDKKVKKMPTYSFSDLKEECGGCDFLKCDCEGYEWFIKPEELKGVRRIEMELHNYNPSPNNPNALIHYIQNHFSIVIEKNGMPVEKFSMQFKNKISDLMILHAKTTEIL